MYYNSRNVNDSLVENHQNSCYSEYITYDTIIDQLLFKHWLSYKLCKVITKKKNAALTSSLL